MFDKNQLLKLKPLIIFFIVYTSIFLIFSLTIKFTFPFLAGFLLALLAQPIIGFLKRHFKFKHKAAAVSSTIIVYILLFGILFLLGIWLIYEINTIINNLTYDISILTGPINDFLKQAGDFISKINPKYIEQNQQEILKIAQSGAGIITTILGNVLSFLTSIPAIFTMFIVMIFSTYFFSKDMSKIKSHILSFFSKNTVLNIRSASQHGINLSGKYIRSYLLIYFITFLETLIVFLALGIPYPLVLSIVTGIADILPVFGPGTIYIPLSIFYLITGDIFKFAALLIGWILITAVRQIIEPKIVSSSINIHPLSMLAAIYFALVAKSFWLLIYFSLMLICYKILTQINVLSSIFKSSDTVNKNLKTGNNNHN